jgi:hypothetical protein
LPSLRATRRTVSRAVSSGDMRTIYGIS